MIIVNRKNVSEMYIGGYKVLSAYMHGRLLWPESKEDEKDDEIFSCYYNGYWIDEYPWTDDTPWTD